MKGNRHTNDLKETNTERRSLHDLGRILDSWAVGEVLSWEFDHEGNILTIAVQIKLLLRHRG